MIYIYAPSHFKTGGPELLHQLGCFLKSIGHLVKIVYFPNNIKSLFDYKVSPVLDIYKHYNLEYCFSIQDSEEDIVIVPETATWYLCKYKKAKKFIWWLSFDFYNHSMNSKIGKVNRFLGNTINIYRDDILHLAQSYYAKESLINLGIQNEKIFMLSDYLREDFFCKVKTESNIRKKQVLYNPKKGMDFTSQLMKIDTDICWMPLVNYSFAEMVTILQESMIYIDFGNHPGKDRIPREAAICGCCIITGMRGSARNTIDIPIPSEFKFDERKINYDQIIKKIYEIFENYENINGLFDDYRKKILCEKKIFQEEAIKIFGIKNLQ